MPKFFSKRIDEHSQLLKILVDKRGTAAYGYFEGYSKQDFKKDAKSLKEQVQRVLKDCRRLLNEFNKNSKIND